MKRDPIGVIQPRRVFGRRLITRPETGGVIATILVFGFFATLASKNGFLSLLGTANWLGTAAELGIVAIPVGMLMIAGEFDLSVGAMVGATSISVAIATGWYSLSPWVGIAIAALIAVALGLVNGLIVVRTGLPSFIVTLASMMMLEGIALAISIGITGSSSVSAPSSGLAKILFASSWKNFSVSILWWLALLALGSWVMAKTRFGNWTYATGGNSQTARLSGVPTDRVKITLFVCTSLGAVITGSVQTLTFQNGNITLGGQLVFTGIAASVIGGILLTGGYGSPIGSAFGAATYGIISIGVFFLGWNADLTQLFIGALLLLAVLGNHRLRIFALGQK